MSASDREVSRDARDTPYAKHMSVSRAVRFGKTMKTAVTRTRIRGGVLLNARVILGTRSMTENHPPGSGIKNGYAELLLLPYRVYYFSERHRSDRATIEPDSFLFSSSRLFETSGPFASIGELRIGQTEITRTTACSSGSPCARAGITQPRIHIPVYHYGTTFRDDPVLSMQTNSNANPKSRACRARGKCRG